MFMLVYRESMVCNIIANGVVYVEYKNVYKTKLIVLNCWDFQASPCMLAVIHVPAASMRQPMGG